MAPILDLIKQNAVPVNVMRSAAKGALPLSADEMLEVLVYLTQNPLFGQDARMTLAKWDAQSAMDVLGKENTAAEVLLYFWQDANRRPGLMPTLIENAAIPETLLMELGSTAPREIVTMLLASPRARQTPAASAAAGAEEPEAVNPEDEAAYHAFEKENAAEIAAAEEKPFELAPEE